MKKHLYLSAAVLTALLAASCSSDDVPQAADGDMTTFTLQIPQEFTSRAFGDGTKAKNLYVAIYEKGGTEALFTNFVTGRTNGMEVGNFQNGLTTQVQVSLVKGKTYDIVCWAQAADITDKTTTPYSYTEATKQITVNYDNLANYDDNRDAFFGYMEFTSGSTDRTITLHRPFAQINLATSDLANYKLAGGTDSFGMSVTDAATTLTLTDGSISGSTTTAVEVTPAASQGTLTVNGTDYSYLAMAYVLVGTTVKQSTTVTVALDANGNDAFASYPNVPVQANYRTNIFGALLTNPEVFNVVIDSDFNGSYPYKVFDGTSESLAQGGTIAVQKPADSIEIPAAMTAPLFLQLNSTVGSVKIPAANQPITISVAKDVPFPTFTYDKGSVVKDVTIKGDPTSTETCKGFVYYQKPDNPSSLENVTFDGIHFEGNGFAPWYAISFDGVTIQNCVFDNMVNPAVNIQTEGAGGTWVAKNLTVKNNVINYASDAKSNTNGLYLEDVQGTVTVTGNTIVNAPYHGVSITAPSTQPGGNTFIVSDNTITNALHDGIKFDGSTGSSMTATGNTILAHDNQIRVKNSFGTGTVVTITGNSLDMSKANAFNTSDNEPWGIMLVAGSVNGESTINVSGNTMTNSQGHDFFKSASITTTAGSNFATPFTTK